MSLPAPPPVLEAAIQNSANKYGVPADILEGFWHVESGSTFPNPWANGLGYGGEFGTAVTPPFGSAKDVKRIVEPPVQQQADTAASILAQQLRATGGDISKALYNYSGHGYTSVPGETTFGTVAVPGTVAPPSSGGNGGLANGILGGIEAAAPGLGIGVSVAQGAYNGAKSLYDNTTGAFSSVANALTGFYTTLTAGKTWIRVGFFIGGLGLVFIGFYVAFKDDLPNIVPV